jgi:hypothetical protein
MKHQSGGATFRLPACSHRRISAPGCARVWLRAPKGDALPPSLCLCASQRLDIGGELGDDTCTKHTTTAQLGERTTTRHERNGSSARYDELKAKPSASLRLRARVCKPAVRPRWRHKQGNALDGEKDIKVKRGDCVDRRQRHLQA